MTWGMGGYPLAFPPYPDPVPPPARKVGATNGNDPHLRSTQAVAGYRIQSSDGEIGHVVDFIVHEKSWAICHIIVETGHWYSGKEIAVAPRHIERISYEDSKVYLNVTREAISLAPRNMMFPRGHTAMRRGSRTEQRLRAV